MTTVQSPARALASLRTPSLRRDQWWLPAAVVLAIVTLTVGWLALVAPARQDTAALSQQAASTTAGADTVERQLTALRADQAKLPAYRRDLAAAQAALPTTAALPDLLRGLQSLGTTAGVTVTSLDATPPEVPIGAASNGAVGPVYEVSITLTAAGRPDALTGFVAALQNDAKRALLVTAVDEASTDAGSTITVSMTAFLAPTAGS